MHPTETAAQRRRDLPFLCEDSRRPPIQTLPDIERPEKKHAKPEAEDYKTIGQFYKAIEDGLRKVCDKNKHFVKRNLGEKSEGLSARVLRFDRVRVSGFWTLRLRCVR